MRASIAKSPIDAAADRAEITWGTSPEHVIPVDGVMPDPPRTPTPRIASAWQDALDYMGLRAGQPIAGTPVDWVFIGSCTNSRLSDLRDAARSRARHARSRTASTRGSCRAPRAVKREAEAEGLDDVFRAAGFEWREPGCSMCVAANGETVPPGQRSRVDVKPQFRRPPGTGRAHSSRESGEGGGRRDRRRDHGRAQAETAHGKVQRAYRRSRRRCCAPTSIPISIIRIDRLTARATRASSAAWRFEALRYRQDGSENPDFVLNQRAVPRCADSARRRELRLRLVARGRGVGADGDGRRAA